MSHAHVSQSLAIVHPITLSHGRNAVKIVQTRPPGAPQPRTANFSEESPA